MKILIGLDPRCLHTSMPWELARRFNEIGAEVHWVFGGEIPLAEHYSIAGDKLEFPASEAHQSHIGKVLFQANGTALGWVRFAARLWRLKPADYDLVLLQCATVMSRLFRLRQFRTITLGRWIGDSHENSQVLPPIIDTRLRPIYVDCPYTMVYLPGKPMPDIKAMLNRVEDKKFIVYSHEERSSDHPNISIRSFEHTQFRQDLCGASAVICQPESGLVNECLHMGIPLLVQLGQGQCMRQETATALHKSGLVHSTRQLTPLIISLWLDSTPRPRALRWPNVSQAMIDCVQDSTDVHESLCRMSASLWDSIPVQLAQN